MVNAGCVCQSHFANGVPGTFCFEAVNPLPRGPPRKPKQSGHALWVGSLPPATTIVALKEHFSREATEDIESVSLISKSNCAFVNYRTEAACIAALRRFNDLHFNGARLVCRLRRSAAQEPTLNMPTRSFAAQQPSVSRPMSPKQDSENTNDMQDSSPDSPAHLSCRQGSGVPAAVDRYFIIKSLTLQDLELSLHSGTWTTQTHNETILNEAYLVGPQTKHQYV